MTDEKLNLYPWQQRVVDICKTTPTTCCHWYYGPIIGKSTLAKYLAVNHGAYVVGTTPSDMRRALQKADCKILIIHPAYSQAKGIPYTEICAAIDGVTLHSQSQITRRQLVHVIVLSNHPPQLEKLSEWKWHVEHIPSV
jgi:hypothetical protein